MKRILITGICGFVGSTLAKAWLNSEDGLEIYGIDNFIRSGSENNRSELKKLGIKHFHGDIRSSTDFEVLPTVDWVIDASANPSVLAGVDGQTSSRQIVEHNLLGTVNILEYCKRHRAGFILLSTSRVYSISSLVDISVEPHEEAFRLASGQSLPAGLSSLGVSESFSTAPPISLYGTTKLASEALALEYGETFGFPVWINRCGVLAGAGQFGRPDQGIFAYWIHSWLHRKSLAYIGFGGRGYQVRDVMHPRDLIPILLKQTGSGPAWPVKLVNLGGGVENSMSLAQLSSWCKERFGEHSVGSTPDIRLFDIPWLIMDSTVARETWGWYPTTGIYEVLDEIAAHAEKNPGWLELSGGI